MLTFDKTVPGQGLTLVVLGLIGGLAGAVAFGRLLQGYLFETRPGDPVTMAE